MLGGVAWPTHKIEASWRTRLIVGEVAALEYLIT